MKTLVVSLLLVLCGQSSAGGFGTDYGTKPEPTTPRPALDSATPDPTFGSTVTRRTDPAQSPDDGMNPTQGLVHEYAKYAGVNADKTKVAVQVIGGLNRGAWQIRGLTDHQLYRTLSTNGDPEISWHRTDPNLLMYRKKNKILRYHIDTGTSDVLLNAGAYTEISTKQEGRPSDDWRWWAGIGTTSTGQRDLFVADLQTQTVIATLPNVGTGIDWVSISPLGGFVLAMFTDGKGTVVYNRQLVLQRTLIPDYAHADMALDATGSEVLVYVAVTGPQLMALGCPNSPSGMPLASARLSDGANTILLGDCWTADWQQRIVGTWIGWWFDLHESGVLSRSRPGWVLISTYRDPSWPQEPFTNEVFLLSLDGKGTVERLAHHRSLVATVNGQRDYWAEPHCTSDWQGSLVICASTWGETGSHYDLYQIDLGTTPQQPPSPPTTESGSYNCNWTWHRKADGTLTDFSVQCQQPGGGL